MQIVSVGQPFSDGPMQEGVQYLYTVNGHMLLMSYRDPNPAEIASVQTGKAEFAMRVEGDVIFFCFRCAPALPWSDCPFTYHRVDPADRKLPEDPQPGEHALLHTILVDSSTGIVKAMRVLTFNDEFTIHLNKAIRQQALTPWPGMEKYMHQVVSVYRRMDSARLAESAPHKTIGGE